MSSLFNPISDFGQSNFRFWSIQFQILVNPISDFGQSNFRFWSIQFQILVNPISDFGQSNFRFWSIQFQILVNPISDFGQSIFSFWLIRFWSVQFQKPGGRWLTSGSRVGWGLSKPRVESLRPRNGTGLGFSGLPIGFRAQGFSQGFL